MNSHHSLRKFGFVFLFVLALVALSGCDQIYSLLHKEGAEEKAIIGLSQPLEKNPNIEEVQKLLGLYGYDPGIADGVLGPRTREAIKRFQQDNGLEPSRFVDTKTWQKLRVFVDNGFVKDGELNIGQLQSSLKTAGFDPGAIDGKVGRKTKEAITDFQKAHNLKVDGKVGYKTLNALSNFLPAQP